MVNNRWARLSQNEKAELLGIYTSMGYNDLASIIAHYNSCGGKLKADGGPVTNTAQYKSDAYLYNPPVNVGAPIEVPLRYKPLPDYGDYVPQRTTGMLEDVPIELGLEVPQRGYGVLMPDAPSAMPTLDARQDAARRIIAVENSKNNVNGGYDAKTGRWYPHKSHEGGADTIAYGIKLSNGTPEAALALKQGYLTDEQAESAVDSLVQKYYDAAKRVYDGRYGAGEWDKLSDKSQSILVDYSYNPGLAKFPKLMEGFHSGNLDLIRKNYKRYVNGKELGRNKVLLEELDTLENEYPIFRSNGGKLFADGGPELNSGWNAGASIINRIKQKVQDVKEKYLSDYADSGYVYSYPSNPVELMKYAISPYAKTDEYGDMMLRNMPEEVTNARRALFAKNFQIDIGDKAYSDAIVESRYKPTKSSDDNAKYYTIPIDDVNTRFKYLTHIVGSSNIAPGEDEHGKYISMYDIWDLAPFSGEGNDFKNSKPVEIYDRFYESEAPDIYNSYSTPGLDAHLPNSGMAAYSSGGKIHIKPENRGKFTALKKRTGHSASWFKAHGTPAQKKMAVFALNAKKWKHGDGGSLDNYLYDGGPYGVIPLGGDYLTYLQTIPEVFGGTMDPAVVTAALPAKFNGSQATAARYAEGYQKGAKPVSEAMNRAGQDIFRAADTVAGFIPGPVGMIDWLGHMGADAAEGNWGKVGRDVALATALGAGARGISWLKNYVDDATNFGEDVFRAFTDRVPGSVSTNFTYTAPATRAAVEAVPAVAKAASTPYEIENLGGGYMLKSLMRGNPLERQISKNGTVNVNNVKAIVGKGSKVEQAVVDKVLASEEFAGKKSIDYNKFRKAVQDELITYDRIPDTRWADYGVSRLGLTQSEDLSHLRNIEDFARSDRFDVVSTDTIGQARLWRDKFTGDILNWDGITQRYLGERDVINAGPGLNTFTFSSSRIPKGSSNHYDPNTLGHSRTYTSSSEPDVLHVMESQSDWAQHSDKSKLGAYRISSAPDEEGISRVNVTLDRGRKKFIDVRPGEGIKTDVFWDEYFPEYKKQFDSNFPNEQAKYLVDNYTSRQIQENLRYAAEKGQTKMRYPTRETAAKIEGYPEREAYFDASGKDVTTDSNIKLFTYGEELDKELDSIASELDVLKKTNPLSEVNLDKSIKDIIAGNERRAKAIKQLEKGEPVEDSWYRNYTLEELNEEQAGELVRLEAYRNAKKAGWGRQMKNLENRRLSIVRNHEAELRPGITKKTVYDYEDILHKYTEFPKQFKKLYKNADVRTVTDPKGNTWYEVDVPENYLQQEWAYKHGGLLREFTNISDIF